MQGIDTIIWDFNGTLLNDVELGIDSINKVLAKRNLPLLSAKRYLEVFGFPVKDYYARIGFDFEKEPFKIPADEFIGYYYESLVQYGLHDNAQYTLDYFEKKGFQQFILSAMEREKLIACVEQLGIKSYFDDIVGLDHDYANSKTELGVLLIHEYGLLPSSVCLIGDTLHDAEVANQIGCECILVANGHQNMAALKVAEVEICSNLKELMERFRS